MIGLSPAELGVGRASRLAPDGERRYDVADNTAALGLTHREVGPLARRRDGAIAQGGSSYLRPVIVRTIVLTIVRTRCPSSEARNLLPVEHDDGSRYVAERCVEARAEHVRCGLRSCSRRGRRRDSPRRGRARHRHHDSELRAARGLLRGRTVIGLSGDSPRTSYLVLRTSSPSRETRGQWLLRRRQLVAFAWRRIPPAVRAK